MKRSLFAEALRSSHHNKKRKGHKGGRVPKRGKGGRREVRLPVLPIVRKKKRKGEKKLIIGD